MLYWLLYPLKDIRSLTIFGATFEPDLSFFRIFGYVSFRAVFATLTALFIMFIIGPRFIAYLKKLKYGESIRESGPSSHASKAGTPTMGGLLIMTSMSISIFLWGNLSNHYVWGIWIATLLLSFVGFVDDYTKSIKKIAGGMKPRVKMLYLLLIAGGFASLVYFAPYTPEGHPEIATAVFLPFLKEPLVYLGALAIPFWILIITGTSNAVNLTDGLDGLAAGISAVSLGTLGILAYITGILPVAKYLLLPFIPEANELAVFIGAISGATIGFLWYNSYPAEIFMGDTGSLAIGGAIGMTAILIKREVLLIILGGIFVAEALSVILQVASYKLRKKRIFLMAPLHHHFELKGWHENKVVIRFWLVAIFLALISLSSLKIV